MTIAPGGSAARGASVPGVVSKPSSARQHRVEHPIELPPPDVGTEPARVAVAERDDACAITAAQRALHDLHRAAHGAVGGLGGRTGRLRILVDQHHHVGGAVGQPLRDVQAAPPRADRPVDRAQLVAGHVPADIGVLDARADVSSEVGAEAVEQVGPRDRRGLRRRQRKHEDVGGVDHARALQQSAARNNSHAAPDRVPAPLVGGDGDGLASARRRLDALEPHAGDYRHVSRERSASSSVSATPHTLTRASSDSKQRCVPGLGVHVEPSAPALPPDRTQHADQWRGERNELPEPPITATASAYRGTREDRERQRRRAPAQLRLRCCGSRSPSRQPLVRGTGSRRNSSSTTSEPCTRRTHISGRRLIRCAMVGTASDLTSSGIT